MKKIIFDENNLTGKTVDMTAEEITVMEQSAQKIEDERQAEETAKQQKADLKASAKAKLMSGEALTEEEANTIVL